MTLLFVLRVWRLQQVQLFALILVGIYIVENMQRTRTPAANANNQNAANADANNHYTEGDEAPANAS